MPLSFRYGITQCSKSNLSNKDWNCITIGLLNCHVHFKQPHNNMYGHSSFIQNINNQSKNIHTTMRHLKRKNSKDNCCKCKIWQNMLVHYVLDHVNQHFFHKWKPRRKLNTKVSFEVKCSHKWTKASNPCKYITPHLPKIVVEHHHFFLRVCGTKNAIFI
jgi:hypothetical protein